MVKVIFAWLIAGTGSSVAIRGVNNYKDLQIFISEIIMVDPSTAAGDAQGNGAAQEQTLGIPVPS